MRKCCSGLGHEWQGEDNRQRYRTFCARNSGNQHVLDELGRRDGDGLWDARGFGLLVGLLAGSVFGVAFVIFTGAEMSTLVELVSFQRVEPRKTDCVHEQGNCNHDAQNLQDIEASVSARKHGKGELHS